MVQRRFVIGISIAIIAIVAGAALAYFFLPQQRPQRSTIFTNVAASNTGGFQGGNFLAIGGAMGTFDDQSARLNGMFIVSNTATLDNVKAQGTWQSTSLISFTPFNLIGPNHWSGMLIVKTDLTLANSTVIRGETLTVICAMPGAVLPSGMKLPYNLQMGQDYVLLTGGPLNFDQSTGSGFVMFTAPSP